MIKSGRKTALAAIILVSLAGSVFLIAQGFKGSGNPENITEKADTLNFNKPFDLPDNVTFAGEKMPLENFDVSESLEREILTSAYRHSSTILIIKRAHRYLPAIEKILARNGIPDDFKYLVAAESEFSNVVSPAGARGFWQIMQATGREAGMEINDIVDERYDLERSTQFACDYFKKSYEKYNNWTLAAASYNSGRNSIDEQIEIQKENNYYDLLLNEETARYIFRAVAYKLVITDPGRYGFDISPEELYPELDYYEVTVDTSVTDFSDFAKRYGTNYKMLKFLNPWLRKPYLTPKSPKSYVIRIPAEGMRRIENSEIVN